MAIVTEPGLALHGVAGDVARHGPHGDVVEAAGHEAGEHHGLVGAGRRARLRARRRARALQPEPVRVEERRRLGRARVDHFLFTQRHLSTYLCTALLCSHLFILLTLV